MPASRAGRRGFESRLPLQETKSLEAPLTTICSNLLRLHYSNGFFQGVDGFFAALQRRLGVLVLVQVYAGRLSLAHRSRGHMAETATSLPFGCVAETQ